MNMLLSELNPHIRYARVHKIALHGNSDIRVCYDCRIFFFDHVNGTIDINGSKYDISNKSAIFLPPETHYRFDVTFQKGGRAIILDFDLTNKNSHIADSLGPATEKTFQKELVPTYNLPESLCTAIVSSMPQLDHLLTQCTDNFLLKKTYYREASSAILKLCLLEFALQDASKGHTKICEDVLAFIHKNYAITTLTNQEIADHFNYHPNHLSSIIKQETGRSLHQYLIYYRLQVAKDYLLTTQFDISEIAWRCGFGSQAYFIKQFRENVGVTPKIYRKQKIQSEL